MFDGLAQLLKLPLLNDATEDILCGICKSIMIDACQILCGCRFCRRCIMDYIIKGCKQCPMNDNEDCRKITLTSMDDVHSERETNRVIMGLKVKCPNIGCNIVGEINMMITHVAECKNVNDKIIPQPNNEIIETTNNHTIPLTYDNEENINKDDLLQLYKEIDFLRNIINSIEKSVQTQFEGFEKMFQELKSHMNKVEAIMGNETLKITAFGARICNIENRLNQEINDDFIWKITHFSQKKANNGHMYSDSFYTRKYGYKIILLLYPMGDDHRDKNLSLYFKIMKGEYDEILSWPFKYDVEFSILDQEGLSTDFTSIVKYQSSSFFPNIYDKPMDYENRSYGKSNFFTLSSFKSQPYLLKNDTLFLKFSLAKNII